MREEVAGVLVCEGGAGNRFDDLRSVRFGLCGGCER